MLFEEPAQSSVREWPTKEKNNYYKFSSFWIELGQNRVVSERATYGALEWIGDIGGLMDGLSIVGALLAGPVASFSMRASLFSVIQNSASNKENNEANNQKD